MPARRKERQREIEEPVVAPPPKRKGRGAPVEKVRRTKEPLRAGRKVKGA
jgi:hypothetical protein